MSLLLVFALGMIPHLTRRPGDENKPHGEGWQDLRGKKGTKTEKSRRSKGEKKLTPIVSCMQATAYKRSSSRGNRSPITGPITMSNGQNKGTSTAKTRERRKNADTLYGIAQCSKHPRFSFLLHSLSHVVQVGLSSPSLHLL